MRIRIPAKVNLFLRVVERRADSYHEVETVLQSIGLYDTLEFAPAGELTLACDQPDLPLGPGNLVWKAAEALRARFGVAPTQGASIAIQKQIPVGAGLGGGSADAAATLVALAQLWGLDAGRSDLEEVAAGLGSDVPFFLTGGAMLARGRGERLTPLPPGPSLWLALVPGLTCATFAGSALAWWGRQRGATMFLETQGTRLLLKEPERREELVDRAQPFGAVLIRDTRSNRRVLLL